MRVGYCKVYRSCFRTFGAKVLEIFVLMIRQFHRNESSWNVRSTGANVPRNESSWNLRSRGTKVPQERKFQGANVSWNESSTGAKVLSMVFSLPGTKVHRNEKAWNPYIHHVGVRPYRPQTISATAKINIGHTENQYRPQPCLPQRYRPQNIRRVYLAYSEDECQVFLKTANILLPVSIVSSVIGRLLAFLLLVL